MQSAEQTTQDQTTKASDPRNLIIGFLLILAVILGGFVWNQQQELDELEARLSTPECYTAFGNVYQQCLADWLPWYDVGGSGLGE